MIQIENSQNEMDHTLYALDLLTQSEKNLPNTTSSITEQKISTIVQYLKTHSDEPLNEMYHFTLEVMNDLNGYIQTMDKIEEYKQILNGKTDKINLIKSRGEINPELSTLEEEVKSIEVILKIAIYRFEKSFKKFKKEQIEMYNKKLILLKRKEVEKRTKDKNIWYNLLNNSTKVD